MIFKALSTGTLLILVAGFTGRALDAAPDRPSVSISEGDGRLTIQIDGELFSEYHYKEVSRPFFYPVIGPGGAAMTRDWPMKEGKHDAKDHPHHRSLWYAHGDVNGVDFWSESSKAGRTVHDKFLEIQSGETGVIKSRNRLVAKNGAVVATDERTMTIRSRGDQRFLDFTITLHASEGEVVYGDTKEGTMAIRVAPTMRLQGSEVAQGHILNSEGERDGDTWGKRAKWCDYYGPVDGQMVGVAIFDHPKNPRYPTWWHVRSYGLFAANPFGIHDFEKKSAGTGDLRVPAGESITFRYRFYFHKGNPDEAEVEKQFQEFASTP